MATLKEITNRIKSVQSTKQITKAMEMVAASKLKKLETKAKAIRPYAKKIGLLLDGHLDAMRYERHPLFDEREDRENRKTGILVVAGDKGLCGAFNTAIFKELELFLKRENLSDEDTLYYTLGKKAAEYLRKSEREILEKFMNLEKSEEDFIAKLLTERITNDFLSGKIDSLYLIATSYVTPMTRDMVVRKLLPFSEEVRFDSLHLQNLNEKSEQEKETMVRFQDESYIYEPDKNAFMDKLVVEFMRIIIRSHILESTASEFGARMVAMKSATDNASEMIDSLTLLRNRTRQAKITQEIVEVSSGAEALK